MSSNCINRQKALKDFVINKIKRSSSFFKSKKTSLDRSDLFIAENHKSVNCASRALTARVFTAEAQTVRMRYPVSLWWSFRGLGIGLKKLSVQSLEI